MEKSPRNTVKVGPSRVSDAISTVSTITLENKIIRLILLAGIALSTFQFLYNRSLWLDEAYLALNIIHKNYYELLHPLDWGQVAPILFLQIEKSFSTIIGNSEYGLRIFPLISYWLSIMLFYKIVVAIHHNYYTTIFSLSLLVFNTYVINYSSEVKQYMSDMLVCLALVYFLLKAYQHERSRYYVVGCIGAISIFLTNVSPIILFTVGLYLLYDIFRFHRRFFLALIGVSLAWTLVFVLYYIMFIHNHPSRAGMVEEWTMYGGFMPLNPLRRGFYQFLYLTWSVIVKQLFPFGKLSCMAITFLMPIGIINLIGKKEIGIAILVVTPLCLHLLLSGMKLYPFSGRFVLYTIPCIIIASSYGFSYLLTRFFPSAHIYRCKFLAMAIPLAMAGYTYANGFPMKTNEIKECIRYIEHNMNQGDTVYVNCFARIPLQYYRDISFVNMDRANIIANEKPPFWAGTRWTGNTVFWNGKRWATDTVKYTSELSLLNGRVWFLFTNVGDEGEKQRFLVDHFNSVGKRILQDHHAHGSDVYLYDLGNAQVAGGH